MPLEETSSASGRPAEASRVESYSIKIPPYWPADPQIWFAQVESQFAARGITAQRTMYDHIVGSLSTDVAMGIKDLLLKPPEEKPYNVHKQKLTELTAASEQHRL